MMKEQALYNFFSSFDIPAFEENSVPSDSAHKPAFPYLTYPIITDSLDNNVILSVSLWYKDKDGYSALLESVKKKNEIEAALADGGQIIQCDGGRIWLKKGSPFAQVMGDESDDKIKRQIINIEVEYFTAY